jgi:hypothetical protein
MVVVNYLANALPIGGVTTGEASDAFANLFTPAGLTFSIWGLIYFLLLIYVVYQFGVKSEGQEEKISKINIYFLITSLTNIAWIFAWHYGVIWLSVILMLVLLVSLIKLVDIINVKDVANTISIWVRWPFSIYFGWITVATIANITVLLVSLGWDRFGIPPAIWTIIILIVGAIIGVWRTFKDRNIPYVLVLVWAYAGILLKHVSESGFDGQYSGIIATLILCELIFLVVVGGLVVKPKFFGKHIAN